MIYIETVNEQKQWEINQRIDCENTVFFRQSFIRRLEWGDYEDPLSLRFLKEVGQVTRKGLYGAELPGLGYRCISAMDVHLMSGLMILSTADPECSKYRPIVKFEVTSEKVWRWLAENADIHIRMLEADLGKDLYEMERVIEHMVIDDIPWEEVDERTRQKYRNYQALPYLMNRETEENAYEGYKKWIGNEGEFDLKSELSIGKYLFGKPGYRNCGLFLEKFGEYQVINHCGEIKVPQGRLCTIFICGKRNGEYEFVRSYTRQKHLAFAELFVDAADALLGGNSEQSCGDIYEQWFSLVLDSEKCETYGYPDKILFGVEVKTKEKCMEVYSPGKSADIFHARYSEIKHAQEHTGNEVEV